MRAEAFSKVGGIDVESESRERMALDYLGNIIVLPSVHVCRGKSTTLVSWHGITYEKQLTS